MACSGGLDNGLLGFMLGGGFLVQMIVWKFVRLEHGPIIIENSERIFCFPN
jgi:hypothetical protein